MRFSSQEQCTSSLDSVEAPVILMSVCRPLPLSVALTDRMPLASMSNLTSICAQPKNGVERLSAAATSTQPEHYCSRARSQPASCHQHMPGITAAVHQVTRCSQSRFWRLAGCRSGTAARRRAPGFTLDAHRVTGCLYSKSAHRNLTCGTPRGAVGMPSRRKLPRDLLSLTNSRSPCSWAHSNQHQDQR